MTDWLVSTPTTEPLASIMLAHGAGAPMDSEFMNVFAGLLCAQGLEVVRFEFPYMAARRATGKKRPPERMPVLTQFWCEQITQMRQSLPAAQKLIIGGKSLGGRMASMVADECHVNGLVCLGYPFHPAGKTERLRVEHLRDLHTPTLIVQGTRDPLGNAQEVHEYKLASTINLHWLPDGDHDFKPRVASGYNWQQHLQSAAENVRVFIEQIAIN